MFLTFYDSEVVQIASGHNEYDVQKKMCLAGVSRRQIEHSQSYKVTSTFLSDTEKLATSLPLPSVISSNIVTISIKENVAMNMSFFVSNDPFIFACRSDE